MERGISNDGYARVHSVQRKQTYSQKEKEVCLCRVSRKNKRSSNVVAYK